MIGEVIGWACIGLIVTGPLICMALFERPAREIHPPTNEEHWLSWARNGYISGKLTVREYEASVAHVLSGGGVDFDGRVVGGPDVSND